MNPRLLCLLAMLSMVVPASAATLNTLHSFCASGGDACTDGSGPLGTLVQDETGALYGVALGGGTHGDDGVVYALTPNGTAWTYQVLYDFCARTECKDGANPSTGLIRDTQGRLYGLTLRGGRAAPYFSQGGGVIYRLTPNARHTRWKIALLHSFCQDRKCTDGAQPYMASLTYAGAETGAPYDGVSPLYGITSRGGNRGLGVAFALTFSGGVPAYNVIYQFCSLAQCADGAAPSSRLTLDAAGNLYGTGEFNSGELFKLSPSGGGSWSESVVYNFCAQPQCADGYYPSSAVLEDAAGNLLGSASTGGLSSNRKPAGTLYKLAPDGSYSVLKEFCELSGCADGGEPVGDLAMDGAGTLYGVTEAGGNSGRRHGVLFAMGSSYQVLYKFCSMRRCADGDSPSAGPILGGSGHLFGTTGGGGANGQGGTVYEYVP